MINIGVIGWRNHASTILKYTKIFKDVNVKYIFHPAYVPPLQGGTTEFNKLLECDGVMILSPNETHFHYINRLISHNFKGMILCEKPPVSTIEELKALKAINPQNVIFNFPLRFSNLKSCFVDNMQQIGEPISVEAIITHGLAFKESYKGSWRSDASKNGRGVLETVSIHLLDLTFAIFGKCDIVHHTSKIVAKTGTAADTCHTIVKHEQGTISTLLTSYAAPAIFKISVIGSDGVMTYDDLSNNTLEISSPRDTFDVSGNFAKPPVTKKINVRNPFDDGTLNLLELFFKACETKTFNEQFHKMFLDALVTMELILKCT